MRTGATKQRKVTLAILFVLLAGSIAAVTAHARHQAPPPIYTTGSDVPDPNRVGNIDQAMQQTQRLLTALKAVNFDPIELIKSQDFDLMVLPDAKFAENEAERGTNSTSYCFPDVPEQRQIACFTDIYARQNRSYYKGDTMTGAPSGFFIVAWKDGRVQAVPVNQVRELPTPDGGTVDCFPGMTGYNPALRRWSD